MTSWLAHYGVVAIVVLMFVDALFPAASELVMVYGGALASGALTHRVDVLGWHGSGLGAYAAVVIAGVAGYQAGAIVGWWIGIRGGRALLERRGRLLHLPPERLDRAEAWFARFDAWAVLVGRVTPVARSFVSIPAGVFESPFGRYNVLTLAGNAVWCAALAGIGWGLGASWDHFHRDFRYVEYLAVLGIVLALVALVVRLRQAATIPDADADSPR
ncbi:MAG TPA: DedA family protein [Gaiellaceae bacterium]|nr:DedA family protein [Gaiellaceae bacterium]